MYRVIRTGRKPDPKPAMSDIELLQGFWELEVQLGKREKIQDTKLLDIPVLNPIPMDREELIIKPTIENQKNET